jgi:hypothetical protein
MVVMKSVSKAVGFIHSQITGVPICSILSYVNIKSA